MTHFYKENCMIALKTIHTIQISNGMVNQFFYFILPGEVAQTNDISSIQQPMIQTNGIDNIEQQYTNTVSGLDQQPVAQTNAISSAEQQPMDLSQSNDIIMAASIASGIDNLAAAALECQKQDDQLLITQENSSDIVPPTLPQETTTPTNAPTGEVSFPEVENEEKEEVDDHDMVEISLAAFNINCTFCSSAFTSQMDLRQHFDTVHRISSEQIEKLIKDIEKAMKRKQAVSRKTSPGRPRGGKRLPTDCELCEKVFSTRKNYLKHNKSKHHLAKVQAQYVADAQGKRLKKCNHCSFSASSAKELTDHIKKRHSHFPEPEAEERVPIKRGRGRPRKAVPRIRYAAVMGTCPECGKQLKGKLLTLHITRCQAKNTQSKCSECGKTVLKKALYRHQRRCINKKHLICPLCKHQSRERYDYSVHVNNHKTWMPAELGDMPPPKQDMVDGAAEQDQSQDPMRGLQEDENKGEVNETSQDTISTLDLSVLGLTPTPTPSAPAMMQDQIEVNSRPEGQVSSINGEATGLVEMESSPSNKQMPSNFTAGEEEQKNARQKQLKCHSCENWFQRSNFKHHMFGVHNLVKKFKCRFDNCNQATALIDQFLEHVKSHGDDSPFTCGCRSCLIRNANTDNPEYITQLKKQKLKEYYQGMIYKCNKCWVKFPNPEGLEKHNRKETHSHPCPSCGKVQVSKRQLRMHMVTHVDERNFLCEECGASFKTKRDLKKHHMSHSDFKPYVCQDCGKGFLFKNKLDRHRMTVHSNEKPFKCTFANCEKAFSRRDKLNDHARTHLYYEPFHCRFCPKGFFRKDNLKDHEVLHTKDYRFKCDKCPKGFMRPKLLARHIAHEHGAQNAYDENSTEGTNQNAQVMPLKLTKPKSHKKSRTPKKPAAATVSQSTEAQTQNLTSQITYMIYQQAGSSMAAALQQAMQSVNAGAEGLPVTLPPEVLQAYHLSQHGGKDPQHYQVPQMVGAEEQISPDALHDRTEFRLA